jgi:hypothetical protein
MVRSGTYLAAGALASAFLLAGFGGAIAAADTTDSAGGEKPTSTASDSSPAPAASGGEDAGAAGDQTDKAVESKDSETTLSTREQTDEKQPVDHDPGSSECPGKTIHRPPPPVDLAPLPHAPALGAPPPADLPPNIPASPVDPDPIDSVAGERGHRHGGNEPPVLTAPMLVAPAPLPPVHIVGTSIAPRGRAVDPTPQPVGEPSPRLLRASADGPPLRDPTLTSFGVTTPGQIPYRTGYSEYSSRPLGGRAAEALPGVAGLVIMTASGICLGYRQAKTAQELRTNGVDRFMS